MKNLSVMCGFLIHMLLPTEMSLLCLHVIEKIKKTAYKQRIREIEHSSFVPLIFSASGGMGFEASVFYKRLASLLAEKWGSSYSLTLPWLRCGLIFALLRSFIRCIRRSPLPQRPCCEFGTIRPGTVLFHLWFYQLVILYFYHCLMITFFIL